MATNKFEREIQQKLNKREIQPSASAWERLSYQLDSQEKKRKRSWFLYVGYAASIALLISLFVFTNKNDEAETRIDDSIIVNKDSKLPIVEENTKVIIGNDNKEEVIVKRFTNKKNQEKPIIIKEITPINNDVIANKSIKSIEKEIDKTIDFKQPDSIRTVIVKKEVKDNLITIDTSKFTPLKNKISVDSNALLFAVTHSKEEIRGYYKKYKISQAKVLKTIQNELNKTNLKIDPSIILAEVEMEVNEESFQNNFYQFIKSKVSDVAVAISNRNN